MSLESSWRRSSAFTDARSLKHVVRSLLIFLTSSISLSCVGKDLLYIMIQAKYWGWEVQDWGYGNLVASLATPPPSISSFPSIPWACIILECTESMNLVRSGTTCRPTCVKGGLERCHGCTSSSIYIWAIMLQVKQGLVSQSFRFRCHTFFISKSQGCILMCHWHLKFFLLKLPNETYMFWLIVRTKDRFSFCCRASPASHASCRLYSSVLRMVCLVEVSTKYSLTSVSYFHLLAQTMMVILGFKGINDQSPVGVPGCLIFLMLCFYCISKKANTRKSINKGGSPHESGGEPIAVCNHLGDGSP